MENFWQTCSSQLELELTPQQYTAWIKPLVALDYEDGKLRVAAPNRFKLDWVKTQFANRITELASQYWERRRTRPCPPLPRLQATAAAVAPSV
jgi:chromosomal replication initiator protein